MSSNKKTTIILFLLFIPVAYASYLFHEFGHWIVGEILGNDMAYSLNRVWPEDGHYMNANHEVLVLIGGPAFTILLSALFLIIIEKYKIIYAYPVVFFQMFMRFFSLSCGGFIKQDEYKISTNFNLGTYTVAIAVVFILFLIVWKASNKLKINLKENCYILTMSTLTSIMVIVTYKVIA